jgi:archaellum biogenesis ATPase FlaH
MIDREQIYKWWSVFHDEGEITEIRALGAGAIYSGYYKSIENAIRDIEYLDKKDDLQIYFIINAIREDCYGRVQREKLAYKPKTTTDAEIIGRKWLMIDLDPKRTSGISSTDEELEYAHQKAIDVYKFLRDNGFNEPIICMSGNGYHLMYSCRIAVSPETDKLVERFINALAMIFSDDKVDVDTQCKNNARLSKLYGTTARKGSNSPDRPWRMSKIVRIPNEIKVNDIEYIKKIANLYPEEKITPSIDNNWGQEKFDVEDFLNKHNIEYKKENYNDGVKYVLKHCAFNESHTGKDAVVFQRNNGALAYVCLHNSCSHYTWKDFRLKFEPNAYDKKDYKDFQYKQRTHSRTPIEPFTPQEESEDKGKKWLSMKEIKRVDIDSLLSIPTGYEMLDKKIVGLFAGELTIISGLNASGKTSWLDCLALNVIQKGFKVGIWSGEMQDWRFQGWINQIAAGKSYVKKKQGYENLYYTPTSYCEKIENWLDGKLFLYNNLYGSKWEQLFSDIKELVEKEKVQLIILDNLAALSIDGYDGEKYSRQTKFILDVKDYAKQKNIHIILVAHPRKESTFLRKESISGTADLTNIADNLMLLHRVGKDFEIRAGEFLGKDKVQEYMGFSTVLEVAKNRQFGVVDYLVGMYYEMESRRLKNSIAEHIIYGWQEEGIQEQLPQVINGSGIMPNNAFDNESDDDCGDCPF